MQPEKTLLPIVLMEFGIVMCVSSEQRKKAPVSILVMEFGMKVLLQPLINVFVDVSIIALQSPLESYFLLSWSTIRRVNFGQCEKILPLIAVTEYGMKADSISEQPANAPLPIVMTELGIETDDNLEQPKKALPPIAVIELGIVTDVSFVHPQKALLPIEAMEFGTTVFWHPIINLLDEDSTIALQLSLESYFLLFGETTRDVSPEQ